jgi:hypothetical protein
MNIKKEVYLVVSFIFCVDHMTLMYMVNRPQIFRKITKWFLMFLKYDFKVIYKLGTKPMVVNVLYKLPNT